MRICIDKPFLAFTSSHIVHLGRMCCSNCSQALCLALDTVTRDVRLCCIVAVADLSGCVPFAKAKQARNGKFFCVCRIMHYDELCGIMRSH